MKRIVAIILSLILCFSCGIAAVNAESGTSDYLNKMDAALIEAVNDPSEVLVDVFIFLKSCIRSESEIESIISEKYTWTNEQEHLMYWRREVSEICGAYVQQFIDDNADLLYEVKSCSDGVEFIIAEVTKPNAVELAKNDLVKNMGLYVDTAEVTTDDEPVYYAKMTPALIKEIDTPTDEMIEVYIFLRDCPDKWHIDEIVSQKYTWTNEQEHLTYYRREVRDIIGEYVRQFVDENSDLLDEIILQIDSAEFIIAKVTKAHAVELAKLDIVQDMDTYGEYSEPTWISEMIADAANELYYDPRHTITPRDINVTDHYQFSDVPAYAVSFSVRNLCYICVMIEERVGGWLLVCSHPEPYLFINDRLYGFKEAYDEGIMTDDMLEELAASGFNGGNGYSILTRYIKGDADGDGEVSIIDATVIQRYEANIISETGIYKPLADVDSDNEVSIIDATLIQRSEAGIYTIE